MPAMCVPGLARELRDIATLIRRGRPYTGAAELERLAAAILSRGIDPGPDAAPPPAEPAPDPSQVVYDKLDAATMAGLLAMLPAGTTITLGGGRSE